MSQSKQENKLYFYPLYEAEDQRLFNMLVGTVAQKTYPELTGSVDDFSELFKYMLYLGKAKAWRELFDMLAEYYERGRLDLKELVIFAKNKSTEVPTGVNDAWAIFTQDKNLCLELDKLAETDVRLQGDIVEAGELLKRYWVSQYLQDWPKIAMTNEILQNPQIKIKQLIAILQNWDFTGIFI